MAYLKVLPWRDSHKISASFTDLDVLNRQKEIAEFVFDSVCASLNRQEHGRKRSAWQSQYFTATSARKFRMHSLLRKRACYFYYYYSLVPFLLNWNFRKWCLSSLKIKFNPRLFISGFVTNRVCFSFYCRLVSVEQSTLFRLFPAIRRWRLFNAREVSASYKRS